MMKTVALAALTLALAGTAAAQPGNTPPAAVMAAGTPPAPAPPLSEDAALGLSLGGTLASWGVVILGDRGGAAVATLGAVGTMLAPSFGHWYARSFATRGLGLRLLGLGVGVIGTIMLLGTADCEEHCNTEAPAVLLIAGSGLFLGGTIDDIATAPRAARRYNDRQGTVSIVPTMRRDDHSLGLAITGSF